MKQVPEQPELLEILSRKNNQPLPSKKEAMPSWKAIFSCWHYTQIILHIKGASLTTKHTSDVMANGMMEVQEEQDVTLNFRCPPRDNENTVHIQ